MLAALLAAQGSAVAGPRVGHIDWLHRVVTIERQILPGYGGLVTKRPKGSHAPQVPILKPLEPVLKRLSADHATAAARTTTAAARTTAASHANNEDDGLTTAPSVRVAPGDRKAPEVEEAGYLVFDANGRQAYLAIKQFDIVIREWTTASDLPGLRSRIEKCLDYYRLDIEEDMNDAEYVQRAARLISNENVKNQWSKWPRWLEKLWTASKLCRASAKTANHGKQARKPDVYGDARGSI